MQKFYCLDLTSNPVKKFIAFKDELEELKNISEYDLKIFKSETEAEKYYEKYFAASMDLKRLRHDRTKETRAALLYKRRYLIQTKLGEKLQTVRGSNRVNAMMAKLNIGDKFTLHDQTFCVTVKLTKVKKLDETNIQYEFKLAD